MACSMKCECDYRGCGKSYPEDMMTKHTDWNDDIWLACPECEDKLNDSTGYCGMSCMFGYGCDQSC